MFSLYPIWYAVFVLWYEFLLVEVVFTASWLTQIPSSCRRMTIKFHLFPEKPRNDGVIPCENGLDGKFNGCLSFVPMLE